MKKRVIKKSKNWLSDSVKEYVAVLSEIHKQITHSQAEAITAINTTLNKRNWLIGKIIAEKQEEYGWGSNFLERLAKDMQNMAPGNSGFSAANIYRMKAFYLSYENIRAAARELEMLPIFHIPWFHNVLLLQKVKTNEERLWYAQQAIEHGWSRSALEDNITSKLYKRQGKAITNFKRLLPSPDSVLAQQALKDPYVFDFLELHDEHLEQDLERGLIENVQKLLLEMGKGFALIARQYHLEVGEKDYYIDLLFYHVKLKCYVVVELKSREFEPGDVGQINFYLSAVDDLVKDDTDRPTIGLLLCKTKNNFTAEYALRSVNKPIGVAEYETAIMSKLPKELKGSLPSIEQIENELAQQELLSKKRKKKK